MSFSWLLDTQLRLFASVSNGRKGGRNNGTVNKTNAKAKKLTQDDEPPLTIYPFSINDLQKPQSKSKKTNKVDAKTGTQKPKLTSDSAFKIDTKPIFTPNLVTAPILTNKIGTTSTGESETLTALETESSQTSKNETNSTSAFECIKTVTEASKVDTNPTVAAKVETSPILKSCKIPEKLLNKSATKSGKSTDKREMDAEKRIQAIVIQNKSSFS